MYNTRILYTSIGGKLINFPHHSHWIPLSFNVFTTQTKRIIGDEQSHFAVHTIFFRNGVDYIEVINRYLLDTPVQWKIPNANVKYKVWNTSFTHRIDMPTILLPLPLPPKKNILSQIGVKLNVWRMRLTKQTNLHL